VLHLDVSMAIWRSTLLGNDDLGAGFATELPEVALMSTVRCMCAFLSRTAM
jgi:hypothetical protein